MQTTHQTITQQKKLSYKKIFETLRQHKQIRESNVTDLQAKQGFLKINASHVQKDDIFIACQGGVYDGHDFINEAVLQKSGLIIQESLSQAPSYPFILVKNTREAWSLLESESQQHASN